MALDLNDKSPNGNNLTNVNTVTELTSSLPSVAGNSRAATFDNTNYFTITDNASMKPTGNFTVELWMRKSTGPSPDTMFQSYSQNSFLISGIRFELNTGSKLFGLIGRGIAGGEGVNWVQVVGATSVTDGNWHHVALVNDGSTLSVYLDGVLDGSTAWTFGPGYQSTNYCIIGAESDTGPINQFYDGDLDDVRFWSTARTLTQLNTYKNQQLYGNEANLIGYWPFNPLAAPVLILGNI